jgi:hypothetical protein
MMDNNQRDDGQPSGESGEGVTSQTPQGIASAPEAEASLDDPLMGNGDRTPLMGNGDR